MAGIFDDAVFAPVNTFMGAPQSWDLANAKAVVLGIPFDAGTHAVRIGARLGPSAIREQSALVRRYEPPLHNFDPLHNRSLCAETNLGEHAVDRRDRVDFGH